VYAIDALIIPETCFVVRRVLYAESSGVRQSPTPQRALGRAIGLRRLEVGLKPEQVADRARLSQRTLEGIEAGTANPSWDTADRIARALDWSIGELARRATELETKDRQPTNRPLARGKDQR
jgi:DNA-binding XRE family transcriptional regulator